MNRRMADRLLQTRLDKGLSQAELANLCGVSQTLIYKIETRQVLQSRKLSVIAHALGVTTYWLINGVENPITIQQKLNYETNAGKVPVIKAKDVENYCMTGACESDCSILCPTIHGEHTFAMVVEGDAMASSSPDSVSFNAGSVIYCDPDEEVKNGRYVIASLKDVKDAVFKKYVELDGKCYLRNINPTYPMIEMSKNDKVNAVVIGKFIKI